MRSLLVALAAASILVFSAARASAGGVQNLPLQCQIGIGATGFETGSTAEHDIVMHLWNVEYQADFHRANPFIDNVVQTVLSAQPSITVDMNAFIGCRFIGMIDGATRAISEIASNQIIVCTNEGLDIGRDLARFNCALTQTFPAPQGAFACYTTIDVECSVNVNLGCRTGFDRYLRDNSFSTCSALASKPTLASFIKSTGCNIH